ncbi:hypothetical protein OAX78_03820 [Planctomycetota bacterium]|nr:hypothetical protein [Planctomycetota bacterium]
MVRRTWTLGALGATLVSALLVGQASGYAIEVHKDFYDLAFGNRAAGQTVDAPTEQDLNDFRQFVWELSSNEPRFAAKWPTAASFTRAAFKEYLALNPGKQIVGIDYVPASRSLDVRTVVREGSVDPDNDYRNQDRFFIEGGGTVQQDAWGKAVPYDPRTVWFGGLTGTPSQFDAHGATSRTGEKGGGIWTAIRRPEQFARPAVVLGSAPQFSETYTKLAMMAHMWGGHGSEWLSLSFAGNNMHGLEDLGNQIHTTVLGIPEFFVDAKWTLYKQKMSRMFSRRAAAPATQGFTAPASLTMSQITDAMLAIKRGDGDSVDPQIRFAIGQEPKGTPTDTDLGIMIIGNHHRLLEDYVQKQYLDGQAAIRAGNPSGAIQQVRDLIVAAEAGDAVFEAECRRALQAAGLGTSLRGETPFAEVLAELMVQKSSPEAATIYRSIRKIAKKELRRGGTYNDELGHEPLDFVVTDSGRHVDRIWSLTSTAFARVVTILRLWDETFENEIDGVTPGSQEARDRAQLIANGLADARMTYIDEAAQRRADYVAEQQADYDEANAPQAPGLLSRIRGWFR